MDEQDWELLKEGDENTDAKDWLQAILDLHERLKQVELQHKKEYSPQLDQVYERLDKLENNISKIMLLLNESQGNIPINKSQLPKPTSIKRISKKDVRK